MARASQQDRRWRRTMLALAAVTVILAAASCVSITEGDLLIGTAGLVSAALAGCAAYLIRLNRDLAAENDRLRDQDHTRADIR